MAEPAGNATDTTAMQYQQNRKISLTQRPGSGPRDAVPSLIK
jgi:hypothetical protein